MKTEHTMSKTDYPRLYAKMSAHPKILAVMKGAQLLMTVLVALAYLYYMVLTVIFADLPGILTAATVSAVPFVAVSLMRSRLGGKRPYEVYTLSSLGMELPEHGGGRSFPSRHAFSAALIGVILLPDMLYVGIAVLVLWILISVSRVLLGIHFIRDVVAGSVIGLVCGVVGALCIKFLV